MINNCRKAVSNLNYFEKEFVNNGKLDFPRFFIGVITASFAFPAIICFFALDLKAFLYFLPFIVFIIVYGIYLLVNTNKKIKQVHLFKGLIYLLLSISFLIINYFIMFYYLDNSSVARILTLIAISFFISYFSFWLFNIYRVKNGTYRRFDSIKIAIPNVFLFAIGTILFKLISISVSEKYLILIILFCSFYLSISISNESVKESLKFILMCKKENE